MRSVLERRQKVEQGVPGPVGRGPRNGRSGAPRSAADPAGSQEARGRCRAAIQWRVGSFQALIARLESVPSRSRRVVVRVSERRRDGGARAGRGATAFGNPFTATEASAEVRRWLNRSAATVIDADSTDLDRALALLESTGAGGGLAPDALIAALGIRHRAVIHTADADFAGFRA